MPLNPICPNCGQRNPLVNLVCSPRNRLPAEGDPIKATFGGVEYTLTPGQKNDLKTSAGEFVIDAGDIIPVEQPVTVCGLCKTPLLELDEAPDSAATEETAPIEAETKVVSDGAGADTGGSVSDSSEPGASTTGEDAGAAGPPEQPAAIAL